jgi:hypothetical protein
MQLKAKISKNSSKSKKIAVKEGILQKVTDSSKINKVWLK